MLDSGTASFVIEIKGTSNIFVLRHPDINIIPIKTAKPIDIDSYTYFSSYSHPNIITTT